MINAPQIVIDALESGNVSYANLVKVNLGDAYNLGSDEILYLTDYGHSISFGGNTYTPDNNLIELEGISRKASTGSDAVDVVFSITDENLIAAIKSERYINKPTSIDRVVMQDGNVVGDFAIPIRTAWAIKYSISGDVDDRTITLTIDSSLGDLTGDNGWYTINASHEQRYAGDLIMRHSSTTMTEEQQKKYTTNFKGVISQEVKPPALSKIYGYKNVELIPICMLKHRKTHTSYRNYFTTMIYAISIGECDHVDINNLKMDDEQFDGKVVNDTSSDVGGWSVRVRTPLDALAGDLWSEKNGDLSFWFEGMDYHEEIRMNNMYGKGLTLLLVKNRNRDDWLQSPPNFTVPVRGAKCYDYRSGLTVFTRNPALQYADYLQSTEYGAGKRGIPVTDANIISLADHFVQIPDSIGNAGINSILIDVQVDTGEPIVDNMNIWMEGVRLYTSDYYGQFNIRVETKGAVDWVLDEEDLVDYPEYESGEFTDRINQLTYTIKQLVQDTSEDAEVGDLVEVDVEATFPADGSQTHLDWIAEDGGIQNFESEQLSYVTELEQAFYWAMVDARISRKPQELEVKVGVKGWLSEVGDILDFSSIIMDMTNELWRVDEVAEDEGDVELKLVPYDDTFYTPDPNAIPLPVAPAQPPTGVTLSPVTGLAIIEKSGFYYLDWTPPSSSNISWYAVEIDKDAVLFVDEPKIAQPPLLLETLTVGDYDVRVVTVGINNESDAALFPFTIALPETPTINITAGNFSIEVYPSVTKRYIGNTYSLRISKGDDVNLAESKGNAGSFTVANLLPNTDYNIWVKTINIVGESAWATALITTLNDNTAFVEFVDLDRQDIINDVLDDLDVSLGDIINFNSQQITTDLINNIWGTHKLGEDVFNEEIQRKTETKLLQVELDDNSASIEENKQVVVDLESATAISLVQLTASFNLNSAEILRIDQAVADETTARALAITTLIANVDGTYATIVDVNQVSSDVSGNASAITVMQNTVNHASTGLVPTATLALQAKTTADNNVAAVAALQASIDAIVGLPLSDVTVTTGSAVVVVNSAEDFSAFSSTSSFYVSDPAYDNTVLDILSVDNVARTITLDNNATFTANNVTGVIKDGASTTAELQLAVTANKSDIDAVKAEAFLFTDVNGYVAGMKATSTASMSELNFIGSSVNFLRQDGSKAIYFDVVSGEYKFNGSGTFSGDLNAATFTSTNFNVTKEGKVTATDLVIKKGNVVIVDTTDGVHWEGVVDSPEKPADSATRNFITTGTADPDDEDGEDGDIYIQILPDTSTTIWIKGAGTWAIAGDSVDYTYIENLVSQTVSATTITGNQIEASARLITPEINTLSNGSGDPDANWSVLGDGTIIHRTATKLLMLGNQAGNGSDYLMWYGDRLSQPNRNDANAILALRKDGKGIFSGDLSAAEGTFSGIVYAQNIEGDVVDMVVKTTTYQQWIGQTGNKLLMTINVSPLPFDRVLHVPSFFIEAISTAVFTIRLRDGSNNILASTLIVKGADGTDTVTPSISVILNKNLSHTIKVQLEVDVVTTILAQSQSVPISVFKKGSTIT